MLSTHQQKYIAWVLSRKRSVSDDDKYTTEITVVDGFMIEWTLD